MLLSTVMYRSWLYKLDHKRCFYTTVMVFGGIAHALVMESGTIHSACG